MERAGKADRLIDVFTSGFDEGGVFPLDLDLALPFVNGRDRRVNVDAGSDARVDQGFGYPANGAGRIPRRLLIAFFAQTSFRFTAFGPRLSASN